MNKSFLFTWMGKCPNHWLILYQRINAPAYLESISIAGFLLSSLIQVVNSASSVFQLTFLARPPPPHCRLLSVSRGICIVTGCAVSCAARQHKRQSGAWPQFNLCCCPARYSFISSQAARSGFVFDYSALILKSNNITASSCARVSTLTALYLSRTCTHTV